MKIYDLATRTKMSATSETSKEISQQLSYYVVEGNRHAKASKELLEKLVGGPQPTDRLSRSLGSPKNQMCRVLRVIASVDECVCVCVNGRGWSR